MTIKEFLNLPLETREAAYQRAREKTGDGALRLVDLCQAAEDIVKETA